MRTRRKNITPNPYFPPSTDGDFFNAKLGTKIPHIVLTGGPSCGKTTALKHLEQVRPELGSIEEAATQVLTSGFPLPTEQRPWTQAWQGALQHAIAGQQRGLEIIAQEDAQRLGKRGIIQDRGLLDGAAYLENGADELARNTGISKEDMLARYHTVIYLGWIPTKQYETSSNPSRFEDESRAKLLAASVLNAWIEHPRLIQITGTEDRLAQVVSIVDQALANTGGIV